MKTQFGENLKFIRKEKKLSQRKLAELIGLDQSTIVSYEKHGSYPTKGKTKEKLLEVLGCTEQELFGYSDGASSKSYGLLSLSELRSDTTPEDDYSMPIYDTTALYPVDPYLKHKYPNGCVHKRYYNMCDKIIRDGSVIFSTPMSKLSDYNNQICAIRKGRAIYIYKVVVVDEISIVLITDNKDKYSKKMMSISDLEIIGKVV